jgi:alpha-beta hydrolase superfamily lysophospholipase
MKLQLSPDPVFHFELLRVLGLARELGADIGEVLDVAGKIAPGDFESWAGGFAALAEHVAARAKTYAAAGRRVSARDAFFRAATYFRAADFYLHGNPADPRISEFWRKATECFDAANARLDRPGERLLVEADGFSIPAIFYRAGEGSRATLLMCSGFDGSQEELLHMFGFSALARGFNVLTFEGPGQPTVIRTQKKTFIDAWEKVVAPLVDWAQTRDEIDATRLGLIGVSLGGWFAARTATREHRLAAVACVDGILDVHASFIGQLPPELRARYDAGETRGAEAATLRAMTQHTGLRWAIEHGKWVFGVDSPAAFLDRAKSMTIAADVGDIQCPVLVCDAVDDLFFKDQPKALAKALGEKATYVPFTAEDSASEHCHVGASVEMNAVVLGWFEDKLAAL